jgi:DNA-directed RNA polymerase specialized sigma24 family protein
VAKGFLEDEELDLLIQFKLEGNNGRDLSNSAGISSNALRQRIKRLLAKLRRLAKKSGHLR